MLCRMRESSPESEDRMADELIRVGSDLPAAPPLMNVTATGEGTAIGFVQGDVRLEMNEEAISYLRRIVGNQPPAFHASEWALLNSERFHLFVLNNEKYDCAQCLSSLLSKCLVINVSLTILQCTHLCATITLGVQR